ncbi:MAG: GAF domain-containing sensor histidine kinase [Kouleothrix sp.]|nr:GAF domain-containing sensor histidine kinase [Kouleothrix sp.]
MNESRLKSQPAASPGRSAAQLRGGWLAAARVGWAAVALLTIAVFVANLPAELAAFRQVCSGAGCGPGDLTPERVREIEALGLSVDLFATAFLVAEIAFVAIWFTVGVVIFWRKSDDRAALFVALFLVIFSVGVFLPAAADRASGAPEWWLIIMIIALSSTCLHLFFFVFPDGRFVPRWSAPLAPALLALALGAQIFPDSAVLGWLSPFSLVPFLTLLLSGVAAQIYRYLRVSGPLQRRQTRLVVFSVAAAMIVVVLAQVGPVLLEITSVSAILGVLIVTYLALLLIPIAIGVAILRYQLWEIRILLSRTLAYGALTACVIAIYALVVGGLSVLLQTSGNALIALVATGLVAALFQPLRDRLQRAVNRLIYGERDDPYAALARLGRRLEATLAPDAMLPAIVETLAQALRLPYAAIALDQGGIVATAAAVGAPVPDAIHLPLVHGGETIGQLILGPRAPGEAFSAADRALIEDLARQAGAAAQSVRLTADLRQLTADLQHSRERLVTAREEERRRLRRDLHDGVGPTLASLSQRLDTVGRLVPRDPDAAVAMLADLKAQVRATIADIRHLVYALRPPVLDELGLVSAIREHAASYDASGAGAPQVLVDAPEQLPPLPAAVEVAAYRIALEALTNIARHARARSCVVRLSLDGEQALCLEIADDGAGMPESARAGVGITSMRERASELGGDLRIEAPVTGGTRVRARLPL